MASKEFPLEAVNVNGPNYLKHALTSCTDPLKAIEEFQVLFTIFCDCGIIFIYFSDNEWHFIAITPSNVTFVRSARCKTFGFSYVGC